jgi:competence protein ComEA
VEPSLPPSPGAGPRSARDQFADLADRIGTSVSGLLAGGAALVVVLAVVAVVVVGRGDSRPPELTIPYAAESEVGSAVEATPSGPTTTGAADVLAHAAGAVARPGVYSLPAGSRVGDLLAAAGGPIGDADVDRLNLAAPVADGSRVYVPTLGEVVPAEAASGGGSGGGTGDPTTSGPLDLNTADAVALEDLPGIGPATAAAIIAHRQEHGPFRSVDDLLDVRGIGDAKLAAVRDLVTV